MRGSRCTGAPFRKSSASTPSRSFNQGLTVVHHYVYHREEAGEVDAEAGDSEDVWPNFSYFTTAGAKHDERHARQLKQSSDCFAHAVIEIRRAVSVCGVSATG